MGRADDIDSFGPEGLIERSGVLGVPVMNEEPGFLGPPVHGEVPGLLGDPGQVGMGRDASEVDPPGGEFDEEQHIQVFNRRVSTVKKSVVRIPPAWARRNSDQGGPWRRGAGPSPWARSTLPIVLAPTRTPTFWSSPWIRT